MKTNTKQGTSRAGKHHVEDRNAVSARRYREGAYEIAIYGGEDAWGVFTVGGQQKAGPFERLRDARTWCRANQRSEEEQIANLSEAIDYVNTYHPLPRCRHGTALRDHGGDLLYPSCGCHLNEKDKAR